MRRAGLGNLVRSWRPEAGEPLLSRLHLPATAVGGGESVVAGLRWVVTVAVVVATMTVTGHMPHSAAVEAMKGGERELPYLDGMEAEHCMVCRDDGGDECRVAREPH